MYFDENKKTLFVIGIEQELQASIQKVTNNLNSKNVLILQTYGPEITEPYGDLMRDIILAVYQASIDEIFVVGMAEDQRIAADTQDLRRKICEHEEMREKIKTIDFLFTHCMPEFQGVTFNEWLEGSKTVIERIQKSVKTLRNHPFIPSDLRVCGLLMDMKSGELSELQVS